MPLLLSLNFLARSFPPKRPLSAFASPYRAPRAAATFTTAGADIDVTKTVGQGESAYKLAPQYGIVAHDTTPGNLVVEYENDCGGDVTIPVKKLMFVGGGFSKIDSTSTVGVRVTFYY